MIALIAVLRSTANISSAAACSEAATIASVNRLASPLMAPAPSRLPVGRLEAFSDAVFAIAITLLVLELGVSKGSGPHLLHAIVHEWPSYLAYATSFLTIGVIWVQHSAIVGSLRIADTTLYRLNLLVLLLASFL